MKTMRELLNWGEKFALENRKEDSAVKLLLMDATQKESYEILADMNMVVPQEQVEKFEHDVHLYVEDNIPVQHIMGYETFFGHKFIVNDDVLIPRFETEELVANVLSTYDDVFNGSKVKVVDVGTGSGAIGVTLAVEEPNMEVTVTELSEAALEVAKQNANQLGANVTFYQGDMLQPLIERGLKFDILVSNPPYIPLTEEVDPFVKDNEPHLALFGGEDGLKFYRQILRDAHKVVNEKNIIAFEHAYNHKEAMAQLIKEHFPHSKFETLKDLNGKDRMTIIINN
ncbi:peptide chain release factor N(5)-glutamine methyltransferase [Turicibacter sp. TS3]|uniref:peptide chain release factor N(5)-glutamine methyltransferase n=1 Tax=Turicibacter sp. TS3 TaxID=2304578 RepID=UPI0013798D7D|nr:peptide chain release factor N(5)-glutamine methyltransferase [Turicibacter sp. TS3]NCE78992.1 peptide chain release factor N(5)-glutamine methyltransferase [Turicibacter sp. TS3]